MTADVAIVIPTFNEAAHIAATLAAMLPQAPTRVQAILVVDGSSTDGTQDIVRAVAASDARVQLIDNPRRLQSAAMNLAARSVGEDITYLIRVDAHSGYPATFVDALLEAARESDAQSVVNRLHTVGIGCFQRAVAAVSNSRFGSGGSLHRVGGAGRFVDHGHHALFDRAWYLKVGGYDESFIANEDAEFDARLRDAGGNIWFTDRADIEYYPRRTPRALALQYYRYGRGRAQNRRKHGEALKLRQLLPPIITVTVALSLLAGLIVSPWLFAPALVYAAGVLAATALLTLRARSLCILGAAIALPIMHIAWGWGFMLETLTGKPVR